MSKALEEETKEVKKKPSKKSAPKKPVAPKAKGKLIGRNPHTGEEVFS